MSWAALASNQTISFNNLQNGVDTGQFTAKTSIPVSNEQITKADANTYVNIDTGYAPYATKSNNQLVVKSDLITTTTTAAGFPFFFDSSSNPNASVACGQYVNNTILYAATSNPAAISRFFTDAGLTNPYGGNGNYYVWSDDNFNLYVGTVDNNGFIFSVSICP